MPTYLVEAYSAPASVAEQRERAARAALTGSGIRYLRTTFLPDDETVLHVFEAASAAALRRAAAQSDLWFDRIVEAIEGSDGT